jgi:hypothetical protein
MIASTGFALKCEGLARMPEGPEGEKRPADEQQKARALSRWENEGGAKAAAPKRPRNLNARGGAAGGSSVAGRTIRRPTTRSRVVSRFEIPPR